MHRVRWNDGALVEAPTWEQLEAELAASSPFSAGLSRDEYRAEMVKRVRNWTGDTLLTDPSEVFIRELERVGFLKVLPHLETSHN